MCFCTIWLNQPGSPTIVVSVSLICARVQVHSQHPLPGTGQGRRPKPRQQLQRSTVHASLSRSGAGIAFSTDAANAEASACVANPFKTHFSHHICTSKLQGVSAFWHSQEIYSLPCVLCCVLAGACQGRDMAASCHWASPTWGAAGAGGGFAHIAGPTQSSPS